MLREAALRQREPDGPSGELTEDDAALARLRVVVEDRASPRRVREHDPLGEPGRSSGELRKPQAERPVPVEEPALREHGGREPVRGAGPGLVLAPVAEALGAEREADAQRRVARVTGDARELRPEIPVRATIDVDLLDLALVAEVD